jgi:hypothetical protein
MGEDSGSSGGKRTAQIRTSVKKLRDERAAGGRKYLSVQLDGDLVEWFRAGCKSEGIKQAAAVGQALKTWLQEKKVNRPFTKRHKVRLWNWIKKNALGPGICCPPGRFTLEKWGIVQHTGQPGEAVAVCSSCGGRWGVTWRIGLGPDGLPINDLVDTRELPGLRGGEG